MKCQDLFFCEKKKIKCSLLQSLLGIFSVKKWWFQFSDKYIPAELFTGNKLSWYIYWWWENTSRLSFDYRQSVSSNQINSVSMEIAVYICKVIMK